MSEVTRNVAEIAPADLQAPETEGDTLPEWCDVYEGLSDQEIAAIEAIVLTRADLTRPLD